MTKGVTRRQAARGIGATAVAMAAPAILRAADKFPSRPIRIVVGYGPGGSTDLAARAVAAHMEKTLGQSVTVENRPGGNGAVGTGAVYNADPDGYMIAMTSGSILTIIPWTTDLGYDPLKMSFIGSSHESLYGFFVKADAPWQTMDELVTHMKANPNKIVFANSGAFGIPDIGMAQIARAVGGLQYRTLPTTGGGDQIVKLLSGDAQIQLNSAAPTLPHLRNKVVRALLVVSPAWPELEKLGVPLCSKLYGFNIRNLSALVGPPKLPEDIRQKLEDALKAAMHDKATLAQLETIGELIGYKSGREIHVDAVKVQAEQKQVGEILGKVRKG